jgi:hypothetical protein
MPSSIGENSNALSYGAILCQAVGSVNVKGVTSTVSGSSLFLSATLRDCLRRRPCIYSRNNLAMVETRNHSLEKAEVEHLLASGVFDRSPGLAQLLTYVCNKYFDGASAEVKEYSIAVDALGRSPSFDQKKDAIVRVQFHRLRDRLKEYYQAEGASRPIRVEIPPGQYIPQFIQTEAPVIPPATPPVAGIPRRPAFPSGSPHGSQSPW